MMRDYEKHNQGLQKMFFKERDLFLCSLENAFLGQMFFIFRKYYILIHKAMIS